MMTVAVSVTRRRSSSLASSEINRKINSAGLTDQYISASAFGDPPQTHYPLPTLSPAQKVLDSIYDNEFIRCRLTVSKS